MFQVSFGRIDDKPIRPREPVTEPDALVIQDPTPRPIAPSRGSASSKIKSQLISNGPG